MSKYLIQGSYTAEGLHGLLNEGGMKRVQATREAIESLGGTLEAFYFAFGSDDYILIVDMPSNVEMTTIALDAQATGTVKSRVTVLITPAEVDKAVHRTAKYRAPGQEPIS